MATAQPASDAAARRRRPRSSNPLSKRIQLQVDPATYDALVAVSDADGVNLAEACRRVVDAGLKRLARRVAAGRDFEAAR